jgi:leucine dehydrogenase
MPGGLPLGEQLVLCHDEANGLAAAISVDDTTLGPGLGGVRWMPYPSFDDAVDEVQRLSRVMTLKNALAHIPYGGAKAVIVREAGADESPARRLAQLTSFAGYVRDLNGTYIPGVDMGTSVADLALIATVAPWVSCTEEDPSPATALGVLYSIVAAVRHLSGHELEGTKVVIQGAGHVGSSLATLLAACGVHLVIADVDPARAAAVAESVGGTTVAPDEAHTVPCDVFAPCASARVLHPESISQLSCAMVVGAANDVLETRACADVMERRGILYVPDFVSNAGGVICIHAERVGWSVDTLSEALRDIGQRTSDLLRDAIETSPLQVAESWASDLLGHPVTVPD